MKIKIGLEDVPVGFQFRSMISLLNFGVFYSFKNYSRNLFFAATAADGIGQLQSPMGEMCLGGPSNSTGENNS